MLFFILPTFVLEAKHKSSPHIASLDALPFDTIFGNSRDEIIHYIRIFPSSEYAIYSVRKLGFFYADSVNEVVKNHIREGKHWESEQDKWIKQYAAPGSVVLDIGAFVGIHTLTMAKAAGPQGRVFAFEASPRIFRELFLNMSLNRIRNVQFFWGTVGSYEGGIRIWDGAGQVVQLLTVDSLRLSNVSLIKIAIFADPVLEGARETIVRNRPVILIKTIGEAALRNLEGLGYAVYQVGGNDFLALPL